MGSFGGLPTDRDVVSILFFFWGERGGGGVLICDHSAVKLIVFLSFSVFICGLLCACLSLYFFFLPFLLSVFFLIINVPLPSSLTPSAASLSSPVLLILNTSSLIYQFQWLSCLTLPPPPIPRLSLALSLWSLPPPPFSPNAINHSML